MCLLSVCLLFCFAAGILTCNVHPVCSVTNNSISGEGADKLAAVVLEMPSMVDFGGILIKPLRDNSVTDLDLSEKGLGILEAMVLSSLLAGASSLVKLK